MPPFLIQNNKPVPMLSLRRVNQHHSRYHSICMFPCPSRSNKRYAFTQQSRRKLLAAINSVCLLSSEGISVRVHPPAFTIRRLSVGGTSLAVFVTAFYAIAIILCPIGPLVNPLSGNSLFFPCISISCIQTRAAFCIQLFFPCFSSPHALTKPCIPCYLFTHIKCDDDVTHSSPLSESRRLV